MTLDLFSILNGRPGDTFAGEVRQRPVVFAVRCKCGDRVASVHNWNGQMMAVCRGRRLTRKHTADEVAEVFFLDVDRVLLKSDGDQISRFNALIERFPSIDILAQRLPALRLPDLVPPIGGLVETIERERLRAAAAQAVPNRVAGMQASCPSCRRNYYVGDALADWFGSSRVQSMTVAAEVDGWSRSTSYADSWPVDGIDSRLRLYEYLSGVLQR